MSKDNVPPGRENSLVSMPHCSKGREWCALYVGEWEVRDILLPVGEIQGIVVKDMASCKFVLAEYLPRKAVVDSSARGIW